MVSFQTPFSNSKYEKNLITVFEDSSSSLSSSNNKKRKRDGDHDEDSERILDHPRRNSRSLCDLDLHLDTRLPSEWQRFLDIKSGELHFYNTKTHKRTLKNPRESEVEDHGEPSLHDHMSLDLELNLLCGPHSRSTNKESNRNKLIKKHEDSTSLSLFLKMDFGDKKCSPSLSLSSLSSSPSSEADADQQQEMVATVCTRCHMLVMLCKSSPSCPNCKFMHLPDHTLPYLFKPRLSLLC